MENTDCIKNIYLVGGAVRDGLLGLPVKDKDYVAVGFCAEDFAHLPKVGKSFPVFLQRDGSQLALARKEVKNGHGYGGFSIETKKVTLYEDLERRDLTINAIALDEKSGVYYDPFNGRKDLENKILRHVSVHFCEDPLRVLRIARFRARLGLEWKIHAETKTLVYAMRDELHFLEKNRVYCEVQLVMLGRNSYVFFETLFELGVLDVIFPSIYALTLKKSNLYHLENSAFAHTMEVLHFVESQLIALKACNKQDSILQNDAQFPLLQLLSKYLTQENIAQCTSPKWQLVLKFSALYREIARTFDNVQMFISDPCPEILLPKAIKKPVLRLMYNPSLEVMSPERYVVFFDSFRRDLVFFTLQIILLFADKSHTLDVLEQLLKAFKALRAYSPPKNSTSIVERVVRDKERILRKILQI